MSRNAAAWSIDGEAFDRLLLFLDPDRDAAAMKYEDVRRRLVKLFSWRGCTSPDEYADRTMDRVARRILDGAEIEVAEPYQYFHGVALNVLREHWREPERAAQSFDDGHHQLRLSTATEVEREAERLASERNLNCLESCLETVAARQRSLLIEYHAGSGQIERRKALAESLGIPLNALRIRVHRIRASVEACVTHCAANE
jgi:DNA-directed RNA polymerase specialized sigma24 family protein